MEDKSVIAIVEDDEEIRELVRAYLVKEQFEPIPCASGAELDAVLKERDVDVIVLDVMMPGEDGLSICRRVTAERPIPVLILSAKGDELDRIIGLEVGADDYLGKPFNPRELVARLRAILRRVRRQHESGDVVDDEPREIYSFEGWRLDVDGRSLTSIDGERPSLSTGEFALLTAFVRHPRRVLTRDQLLDLTRAPGAAPFDRAIDVQLSRLRRKLGDTPRKPRLIQTVRGDGYLFAAEVRRENGS